MTKFIGFRLPFRNNNATVWPDQQREEEKNKHRFLERRAHDMKWEGTLTTALAREEVQTYRSPVSLPSFFYLSVFL